MVNYCACFFTIKLAVKVSLDSRLREAEENKLCHHQVISMVLILTDYSPPPISKREIAKLL